LGIAEVNTSWSEFVGNGLDGKYEIHAAVDASEKNAFWKNIFVDGAWQWLRKLAGF